MKGQAKGIGPYTMLYGDWDDTHCYQFMVVYHTNGITCDVFTMGGSDYGGGVSSWHENALSKRVDFIIDYCPHVWDVYNLIRLGCKEHLPY